VRLLFVKESLAWPRSSGHDVHCYHLMRALSAQGHAVALLTKAEPAAEALGGLPLEARWTFASAPRAAADVRVTLSGFQERFRSYWGIDPDALRTVGGAARAFGADAVVVVGLNVLPYLGAVSGSLRVWYAADEWAWHHLSQVQLLRRSSWGNVRDALTKGLYERAYGPMLDRAWVVTPTDGRAMRWIAGVRRLDVVPNGVDAEHFRPLDVAAEPGTCTFWGRLDFGPNVQALEWFCRKVWPEVRRRRPDARFTVYGFQPTAPVQALVGRDGVGLVADLPDLREEVARHAAVVLPFVSGGGIKNKLLEAASMGKAILCSPRACSGLAGGDPPFTVCRRPRDWADGLARLWQDDAARRKAGAAARDWVVKQHTWEAAARIAARGLEESLGGRR
jgi:glycosyltransferase involved in cell wall biosynthesis